MGFGRASGRGYGLGFGHGYGRGLGGGKGAFSGYSCVKYVFFGFNVFFWLLGCAILGVGIWLQVSKSTYAALSPSFQFITAAVLCISAGILILIVGFFGCCGAIMESKCLLLTYFVLVVLIFILEIVGGVLAFVFRAEIHDNIIGELKAGIKKKYPKPSEKDEDGLREIWNKLQTDLKCCGVTHYTDWHNITAWLDEYWVPESCCKVKDKCNTKADTERDYHNNTCFEGIKKELESSLYIVGIVAVCIGVIQLLGLVASMALFCCLRQDKYYDD